MIVYRLSSTKFANDKTGEGARLNGGRWNHKMTACLYTSASRALALLEYTVNVNVDDIPRRLSMVTLEIPDNSIFEPKTGKMPGDWKAFPAPASTKDFGTELLKAADYHVIKMRSTIVEDEYNYLINPSFPDHDPRVKILEIKDFVYDVRIKTV